MTHIFEGVHKIKLGESYVSLKYNCAFTKHAFFSLSFSLRATINVFSPLFRDHVKMICNIAKTRWNLETPT